MGDEAGLDESAYRSANFPWRSSIYLLVSPFCMNAPLRTLFATVLVSLTAASVSPAADPAPAVPAHNISEFKFGRGIMGPAVDVAQLKGKAVFVDAWGINCGPCLALLPEVEKLSRRHKDKLIVIGAHSQQGSDADVQAVVKEKRLSFAITDGVQSPVQFNGIPFGFVFDATGALVFAGRPNDREFEKAIRKAVQTVSAGAKASGLDALKRP